MATEDKSRRKVWTVDETRALLKCYAARRKEFIHRRKKRLAYAHVLEDMLAQGFADSSITVLALENKMRTLYSSYRCAKDKVDKPGTSLCIAPYMEELDEIFGKVPPVGNNNITAPAANNTAAVASNNNSNQRNNTVSLGIPKTQAHKKSARDSYYTEN